MNKIAVRPLRTLAAIALSGLLLVGCATPPNTAAVVNGTRYTETEVADAWEELQPIVAEGAEVNVVVGTLILRDLLAPVAEEFGISASQEEVDEFVTQAWGQSGAEVPDSLSPVATRIVESQILVNKVNYSEFAAEIVERFGVESASADVSVNPRFGAFDPESGGLTEVALPWLATS